MAALSSTTSLSAVATTTALHNASESVRTTIISSADIRVSVVGSSSLVSMQDIWLKGETPPNQRLGIVPAGTFVSVEKKERIVRGPRHVFESDLFRYENTMSGSYIRVIEKDPVKSKAALEQLEKLISSNTQEHLVSLCGTIAPLLRELTPQHLDEVLRTKDCNGVPAPLLTTSYQETILAVWGKFSMQAFDHVMWLDLINLWIERKIKTSVPDTVEFLKEMITWFRLFSNKEIYLSILSTTERLQLSSSQICEILTTVDRDKCPLALAYFKDSDREKNSERSKKPQEGSPLYEALVEPLLHRLNTRDLREVMTVYNESQNMRVDLPHSTRLLHTWAGIDIDTLIESNLSAALPPTMPDVLLSMISSYLDRNVVVDLVSDQFFAHLMQDTRYTHRTVIKRLLESNGVLKDGIGLEPEFLAALLTLTNTNNEVVIHRLLTRINHSVLTRINHSVLTRINHSVSTEGSMERILCWDFSRIWDTIKKALPVALQLRILQAKDVAGKSIIHYFPVLGPKVFPPPPEDQEKQNLINYLAEYIVYVADQIPVDSPELFTFLSTEDLEGYMILNHLLASYTCHDRCPEVGAAIFSMLSKCQSVHIEALFNKILAPMPDRQRNYFKNFLLDYIKKGNPAVIQMLDKAAPSALTVILKLVGDRHDTINYSLPKMLPYLSKLDCSQLAEVLKTQTPSRSDTLLHDPNWPAEKFQILRPLLSKFVLAQKIDMLIEILQVKNEYNTPAFHNWTEENILSLVEYARPELSQAQYENAKTFLISQLWPSSSCCICQ